MASEVKVYGKPKCVQCDATTRKLTKNETPYTYIDITVDEVAHQEVKSMGFTGAPVVVPPSGQPWSGYSPDKLDALKRANGDKP